MKWARPAFPPVPQTRNYGGQAGFVPLGVALRLPEIPFQDPTNTESTHSPPFGPQTAERSKRARINDHQ
jgi:hypothetical protein